MALALRVHRSQPPKVFIGLRSRGQVHPRATSFRCFSQAYTTASASPEPTRPYRALFFGTDQFSVNVYRKLLTALPQFAPKGSDPSLRVLDAVTVGDHWVGKGRTVRWQSPLKSVVHEHDLWVNYLDMADKRMQHWTLPRPSDWAKNSDNHNGAAHHTTNGYDIGIVASFGSFIPARITEQFPLGMINVHPSLLPKYRGAAPLQAALLNHDCLTGVTIQELHKKTIDAGRILLQATVPIAPNTTLAQLLDATSAIGGDLVLQYLSDIPRYQSKAQRQDPSQATRAPKLTTASACIAWDNHTAKDILAMHRVFGSQNPIHTMFGTGKVIRKVIIAEFTIQPEPLQPPLAPSATTAYKPSYIYFDSQSPEPSPLVVPLVDGQHLLIHKCFVKGTGELTPAAFIKMFQLQSGRYRFGQQQQQP
ncbi:Methionyl-tRNA formyltransferase [Dimargaris xerosporica]|nr:Methionyl-tRNA formyltransferase [Dimargaris xerosporica]